MGDALETRLWADVKDADEGFFAGFDAQRARVLRKRIKWYCIVAIATMVLALGVNLAGALGTGADAGAGELGEAAESRGHVATSLGLLLVYGAALVYVLRTRAERRRLVRVLSVVTIVAICIAVPMEV